MTISHLVIVEDYARVARCLSVDVTAGRPVGEKPAKFDKSRSGSDRNGYQPHRVAGPGVEHPDRNLLDCFRQTVPEPTACHRPGASINHLADVDVPSKPRVPAISDNRVSAASRHMGLVS